MTTVADVMAAMEKVDGRTVLCLHISHEAGKWKMYCFTHIDDVCEDHTTLDQCRARFAAHAADKPPIVGVADFAGVPEIEAAKAEKYAKLQG